MIYETKALFNIQCYNKMQQDKQIELNDRQIHNQQDNEKQQCQVASSDEDQKGQSDFAKPHDLKDNQMNMQKQGNQKQNQPKSRNNIYSQVKQYFSYMFQVLSPQQKQLISPIFQLQFSKLNQTQKNQQISNIITKYHNLNTQKLQQKILQAKIFTKSESFTSKLIIQSTNPSDNYQVIELQVQLLNFKTKICILNIKQRSQLHSKALIHGHGAFGNVYEFKLKEKYAIKCISIGEEFDQIGQDQEGIKIKSNNIYKALQEYFFILLFSVLQIGPKVMKIYDFDVIISPDCIQFSTQFCKVKQLHQNQQKLLKQNLKIMHSLRIVHRDVKPSNIMYSQNFNKPVFIDFGGTQILKQNIGKKSKSFFCGSAGFCTEQVLRLLGNKSDYANLYSNDIFGLVKSLLSQLKATYQQKIDQETSTSNIIQYEKLIRSLFIQLIRLKSYLYNKKYSQFYQLFKILQNNYLTEDQDFQINLLNFFSQLNPCQQLRQIYWNCFNQQARNNQLFAILQQKYKTKKFKLFYHSQFINPSQKQQLYQNDKKIWNNLFMIHNSLQHQQQIIQFILSSKQYVQYFIFQQDNQFQLGYLKIFKNLNIQEKVNQFKNNIVYYLLILCKYCSFTQNHYNVTVDKKIQAAKIGMQRILQYQKKKKNILVNSDTLSDQYQLIFPCTQSQLMDIAKLYQYFAFYILPNLSKTFKEKMITVVTTNLIILGYVLQEETFHIYLRQKILNLTQQNQLQNLRYYWQLSFLIRAMDHIFYYKSLTPNQISSQTRKDIQSVQRNISQQSTILYIINRNFRFFFISLDNCVKHNKFVQNLQKQAQKYQKQLSKFQMNKLIQNIKSVNNLHFLIKYGFKYDKWLHVIKKNQIKNILTNPKLINTLITLCVNKTIYYNQLQYFFDLLDKQINNLKLSKRILLPQRIQLSFYKRNYIQSKILLDILFQTLATNQIHNYYCSYFYRTIHKSNITLLHQIFFPQRQNFEKKLDITQFIIFIQKIMQFIEQKLKFFINQQNKQSQIFYKNNQFKNNNLKLQTDLGNKKYPYNLIQMICYQLQKSISFIQKYETQFQQNPKKTNKHQSICSMKDKLMNMKQKVLIDQQKNQNFEKFQNQDGLNFYVITKIQYYFKKSENEKKNLLKLIQKYYGHDMIKKIINKQHKYKPNIQIIHFYVLIKSIYKQYTNEYQDLQDLVKLYKFMKKQNLQLFFNVQVNSIIYFINAFIYTEKSYQEFQQFLMYLMNCLKSNLSKYNLHQMKTVFLHNFVLQSDKFQQLGLNWKFQQFIQYLGRKISEKSLSQNSYMSFIYLYCTFYKGIKQETIRIFIIFIIKSLKNMVKEAIQFLSQSYFIKIYQLKYKNIVIFPLKRKIFSHQQLPQSIRENKDEINNGNSEQRLYIGDNDIRKIEQKNVLGPTKQSKSSYRQRYFQKMWIKYVDMYCDYTLQELIILKMRTIRFNNSIDDLNIMIQKIDPKQTNYKILMKLKEKSIKQFLNKQNFFRRDEIKYYKIFY